MKTEPVRVGLVGAGPWARDMHAPVLAAGPETVLAGVWARRASAACELAAAYDVPVMASFDELVGASEAVAFAVPPQVQGGLAVRAARAGRHLMLEKPLASCVSEAREVAAACQESGVVTQLMLTKRFHPRTREFVTRSRALLSGGDCEGVTASYVHGAFLDGPMATPWRLRDGVLLDLGPHLIDLVEAVTSPVEAVSVAGSLHGVLALTTRHRAGTVGQLTLSGRVRGPSRFEVHAFGEPGTESFDAREMDHSECFSIARSEFASAVRRATPVMADAAHGLWLQEVIDAVLDAATSGRTAAVSHRPL
ncbi:MAG: Gfo/Idh/MocA family protein [Nocardioidaceae bacterium]